jgi:hypothetical protein
LGVSQFARQALLAASAQTLGKVTPVKAPEPVPVRDVVAPVIDTVEARPHIVDGMRLLPDGRVVDWDEPEA